MPPHPTLAPVIPGRISDVALAVIAVRAVPMVPVSMAGMTMAVSITEVTTPGVVAVAVTRAVAMAVVAAVEPAAVVTDMTPRRSAKMSRLRWTLGPVDRAPAAGKGIARHQDARHGDAAE